MFSCTVFSCPLGPFTSEMCVFIHQFVQKNTDAQTRGTEGVIYCPPDVCLPLGHAWLPI